MSSLFAEKPIISLAKNLFAEMACENGDLDAFKCLVENYEINLSQNDNEYLKIATECENIKLIDYILSHEDFKMSPSIYNTLLSCINYNHHATTLLFLINNKIMEYLEKEYEDLYTRLMKKALKYNNEFVIDHFLENDRFRLTLHLVKYTFAYYSHNSRIINSLLNSKKLMIIEDVEPFLEEIYNKSKYRYMYEFPKYLKNKYDENNRRKSMRDFMKYIAVMSMIYYYTAYFD